MHNTFFPCCPYRLPMRCSAPTLAEVGEEGTELWAALELKLVADVGIIGVPSAGKSTLLSVLSNAKPKIADYPFTTLVPNLGVCELDFRTTVFADIPGAARGPSFMRAAWHHRAADILSHAEGVCVAMGFRSFSHPWCRVWRHCMRQTVLAGPYDVHRTCQRLHRACNCLVSVVASELLAAHILCQ